LENFISIIIPTLNEIKLLPKLLESLQNPDLRKEIPFEVIVSDGGSADGTFDIARQFADTAALEPRHKGSNIASGRNFGASLAKGDIFVFINADVLFADATGLLKYINTEFWNSDCDAMTCFVETFPAEKKWQDVLFHTFYNNYFYLLNKLVMGMGRGECQIIKRKCFESLGGFNEALPAGEDFDLFRRIAAKSKILFSRKFKVYESPRRYRKYGYIRVAASWTSNALSVIRKGKAKSEIWEQVR
jgi:glycosyltransferase involved in cell wall biosynthesis